MMICWGVRPAFLARAATSGVGTKHAVTARWNQEGWQLVRSVTTVANGGAATRVRALRRCSTRICRCVGNGW